ncbi:metallophosphoesterase [Paenibacillus sp. FSL H8-0034]|uniref:metallophosphoesterase n=1 Tax=Paenibacillus sp. FSL H8-0034 TaxID=2954671 RepID=UPI0030F85A55
MKKCLFTLAGLILTPSAGYTYARFAEPRWLYTKEITIQLKRLPSAFDGMRVIQFSDVHLGFHYTVEQLNKLVDHIQSLQPDLICFTGDLFDYTVGSDAAPAVQVLSRLKAPLGKGAVLGNHDYYGKETEKIKRILLDSGFALLINQSVPLKREKSTIWLSGVDDMWDGKPDLPKALHDVPSDAFTLLLSHCPDFADIALKHSIDLQLSGHSHGGQVRLPFYGHLFTPAYGSKYPDGYYSLDDGKLQVYTNRGIGVSVLPIRFFCRPELSVFTLRSG